MQPDRNTVVEWEARGVGLKYTLPHFYEGRENNDHQTGLSYFLYRQSVIESSAHGNNLIRFTVEEEQGGS